MMGVEPGSVDSEGRKRSRVVDVERRLPAGSRTTRVEVRLVAEHGAGHTANACSVYLAGELGQARLAEGRIAVPLEDERSAPGRAYELPLAKSVSLDLVVRPKG